MARAKPCRASIGGRYGLSSKDFTPAMVKAVFDELARPQPINSFTIGVNDDVSGSSLAFDPNFMIESDDVFRAVFYGLGSDGTVGANKNSVKILAEDPDASRKAISSTIPTNPALRRCRTSASGRVQFSHPI